jgi:hypothetical protein
MTSSVIGAGAGIVLREAPGSRVGAVALVSAVSPHEPIRRSLTTAFDAVVSAGGRKPASAAPYQAIVVESALDGVVRSPREEELYRRLGDAPSMKRLRRALIAQRHREVPGVDDYAREFAVELGHGATGIETVREALERLPAAEYPLERVAMIAALGSNPKNADSVKQLALAELIENPPAPRPDPHAADATPEQVNEGLSTTSAQARPLAAQGILLKNARDADEALAGTVEGIASQRDWGIRSSLALQFIQEHPDKGGALHLALASRGIAVKLPPLQPQEREPSEEEGR